MKTERSDKDVRENKYYIHRHTNEGIRTRWGDKGNGQVREGTENHWEGENHRRT